MSKKPTLLFYVSVTLTLLLFCSIIFIFILISKVNSDNNRFNTLSKQIENISICDESTIQQLSKQQFKEDYFINQQNKDTTLILTVFGVTVVFFGFFSYSLFESRINEHKKHYSSKIEEQDRKYGTLKFHFESLLIDITSKEGYENAYKSNESLFNEDYGWYVYYILASVKYFSDYYEILKKRKGSKNLKSTIYDIQVKRLNDALSEVSEINSIPNLNSELIQSYIKDIQRFDSTEINDLAFKLYSCLSE